MKSSRIKLDVIVTEKYESYDGKTVKKETTYPTNAIVREDGKVMLIFDTFGEWKLTWQTPKETGKGYWVKLYGDRVYIDNYYEMFKEIESLKS